MKAQFASLESMGKGPLPVFQRDSRALGSMLWYMRVFDGRVFVSSALLEGILFTDESWFRCFAPS